MIISFFQQVSKKENNTSRRCRRPRGCFYQVDTRLSFGPNKILLFDLWPHLVGIYRVILELL